MRTYIFIILLAASITLSIDVSGAASAQETINVSGRIMWADRRWTERNGTQHIHPVRRAQVEVRDNRSGGAGELLTTVLTDEQGNYTASVAVGPESARDIFIRVPCSFEGARVHAPDVAETYFIRSDPVPDLRRGASTLISLTANNTYDNNTAFSVRDALLHLASYVQQRRGAMLPQVEVIYPTTRDGSQFFGGVLHIGLDDRWDWDVIMHEYGHYVAVQLRIEDHPGGRHDFGQNLSESSRGKNKGTRLAWAEGWPTFLAISAQRSLNLADTGIPNVGDTRYQDTDDQTYDLDMETQDGRRSAGEDDELSIIRILYDVMDSGTGDDDEVGVGEQNLWDLLVNARPVRLSQAWAALTTGKPVGEQRPYGLIFSEHLVAPSPLRPTDQQSVGGAPQTFQWNPNGGGAKHRLNRFVVEFYDSDFNKIFSSPENDSTSYTPTQADWDKIIATGATPLYWVVVGRNVKDPETGRYMGKWNRLVITN